MANEIFKSNRFAIEIVSAGSFIDDDPGYRGKVYNVQTYTIRLNHVALSAWQAVNAADDKEDDDTWTAWHPGEDRRTYRAAVEQHKAEFESQIAAALQITGAGSGSFTVVQIISEIFAVVYIPSKH